MANLSPTDVANQALDAAAWNFQLGDIEEGTRPAQICLRAYGKCRDALLRTAPWVFARRQAPLMLLADASGNTPNVGTLTPWGYQYSYAYPVDCIRIRYIPWLPNINPGAPAGNIVPQNNGLPIMSSLNNIPYVSRRIRPTRYIVTNDPNLQTGAPPQNTEQHGNSPTGRLVIGNDVQNAIIVYTRQEVYPSMWDALFREALVAYIAQDIALGLWAEKDRKFGLEMRNANIAIAKDKIMAARVADGDEMFASSDIPVDWMMARRTGGPASTGYGGQGGDWGCWGGGWGGSCSFADGTSY